VGEKLRILHLPDEYVIGQVDVLEVFVWRCEQLSHKVMVGLMASWRRKWN
jgi:hypothetical protein